MPDAPNVPSTNADVDPVVAAREHRNVVILRSQPGKASDTEVVSFRPCQRDIAMVISADALVRTDAAQPDATVTRADAEILPQSLTLAYLDSDLDYRRGAVESQDLTGASRREWRSISLVR